MRLKNKIILIIALALISLLLFTGCVNVNVGQDINVNKDGSTSTIIRVTYDKSIESFFKDGILSSAIDNDNFTFKKTEKDNLITEEAEFKTKKLSSKEKIFIVMGGDLINNNTLKNDYLDIKINKTSSLFKNKYTLSVAPKMDIYNVVLSSIDNELGTIGNSEFITILGTNLKETIGDIPYTLKLSLPMKIASSNATRQLDEKTILWDYTIKDLNESTTLSLTIEALNLKAIFTFLVLLIISSFITIIIYIKKKRP